MLYCKKEDLFDACKITAVISWAKDDPKDTEEIVDKRIESAIKRATEEVNLFIGKICVIPLKIIPSTLKDITVKLSLYQLLSRRGLAEGSSDTIIKTNRNSAIRQLELISSGKLPIFSESIDSSNSSHKVLRSFPVSPYKRG